MTEYYIKMKDLAVGYQGNALISGINLKIKKGEIVTLIGPNGAGKSTILKSITRQLKLIGGEVYIDSEEIRKLSYKEMAVKAAVMLTERMKPELMTCHDIVATGRYPYTGRLGILSREDERKVDEALEAVHAQELGIRNFQEISDGQRQRVLLARAICQEPEVMILDEPTSYLDIRHKLELLAILRKMAKENGITVIMSLHEIDLAQKISDQVICVKGDRIAEFGDPEEIFTEATIRDLYEIDNGYYRYSEVWNFQSRKENRKFWYYLPVKQESRSTENFRKPGSHLPPESSIRARATISWHGCWHPGSSAKSHMNRYPMRLTKRH